MGTDEHAHYLQWLWFAECNLGVWAAEMVQHTAILVEADRVPAILPNLKAKAMAGLAVAEKVREVL